MANYKSSLCNPFTGYRPPITNTAAGEVVAVRGTYPVPAAGLALNDIVEMVPLPPDCVIVDCILDCDALDAHATPLMTVAAGVVNEAGTDFIAAGTLIAANVAPKTGGMARLDTAGGLWDFLEKREAKRRNQGYGGPGNGEGRQNRFDPPVSKRSAGRITLVGNCVPHAPDAASRLCATLGLTRRRVGPSIGGVRGNHFPALFSLKDKDVVMLIECLIKRDGPTHFNLHGFEYVFKPDGFGHNVREVNSREHREYLLSLKNDFRVYEPPAPALPVEPSVQNAWHSGRGNDADSPGTDR